MNEPDWKDVPDKPTIKRGDLVYVTKKTRGRFGKDLTVATPGDYGIVISSWTSTMGSHKVTLVKPGLTQVATTASCCRFFGNVHGKVHLDTDEDWPAVMLGWMNKTYAPIIIVRELKTRGKGFVASRDGKAILAKPLNSDNRIWLNADKVHPEDWQNLQKSGSRCCSVRVPEWLAKKSGAWG